MIANGTKCNGKSIRETIAQKKESKKGNMPHAAGRQWQWPCWDEMSL
jgi:hypothetical protein